MQSDLDTGEPIVDLAPNIGFGTIRLGDSEAAVRQSLREASLEFEESIDPNCWEMESPWCTLSFALDPEKRLVQISSSSETAQVFGNTLVGLRLDEALSLLGIQRFDDTVWTVGEVEIDFEEGKPYVDIDRRSKSSSVDLLHTGTLWIKSLGLGMSFYAAQIDSIAIRESKYVPRIGYGPLDEKTLTAASDPKTSEALLKSYATPRSRSNFNQLQLPVILGLATLITGIVLSWAIYTIATDYQSWLNATEVVGKLIKMLPAEVSPDELVVEYTMPNSQLAQATIPSQYATAREIGEEVELVYRQSNPSIAMTRLQSRDHFSSISFNWIIYLVPLFALELIWLIPTMRSR